MRHYFLGKTCCVAQDAALTGGLHLLGGARNETEDAVLKGGLGVIPFVRIMERFHNVWLSSGGARDCSEEEGMWLNIFYVTRAL